MGKKKTQKRNRRYVRAKALRIPTVTKGPVATGDVVGRNKRRRQKIRERQVARETSHPQTNYQSLKFGSLNVDGINEGSKYGVEKLIQERKYDVREIYTNKITFRTRFKDNLIIHMMKHVTIRITDL